MCTAMDLKQNFEYFDLIDEEAAAKILFTVCIRYYSFNVDQYVSIHYARNPVILYI